MKFTKLIFQIAAAITSLTFIASCDKDDDNNNNNKPNQVFVALNDNNQLMAYNANATSSPIATVNVTGLASGEKLLSIDFRPATGQLYALSNNSRLYTINLNGGAATAVGLPSFAISGTSANIDFNPTVDRIRLVSNTGQNLRLHPETGALAATDGAINGGASPVITSIAYTNSVSGATATTLYDIDVTTRKLYKQDPPNNGTLVEVGQISVNFTGKGGFDISPDNTNALVTFTEGSATKLYSLNVTNAATTYIADLTGNVVDIAIPTNPVAYAINEGGSNLQIFNPMMENSMVEKPLSGIIVGETLAGLDFRPATGQLYGIGISPLGTAHIYTFNLGAAGASIAATPIGAGFNVTAGTSVAGFDFNPNVDRIRLVTSSGQNFRLHPETGIIAVTDGNINPAAAVSGAAYTNNFVGGGTATLFVIDAGKLYKQDPPNNGTLTEIGSLGVTVDAQNGLDIGGNSNIAYALLTVGTTTRVYTINTTSGAATAGTTYPNKVRGMAVGLGF